MLTLRLRVLLPALWLGLLIAVAAVATPAPFATLSPADAGRVVARVLQQEAFISLAAGILVLVMERGNARRAAQAGTGSQFSLGMLLALGALFCTVVGYFALQPFMDLARRGQGPLTFGQLHLLSVLFYGLKAVLVAVLAWRGLGALLRGAGRAAGSAPSRRPSS